MPTQLHVDETEQQLLGRARDALSRCNWVVGECAVKWTRKYARGRTDADFGKLVGLSGDQVFQRRRVWETFGEVYEQYPDLKWSHFYVALGWEDAAECLQWAQDAGSTVAEMKVWRKLQHGEDLSDEQRTEEAEDEWPAEGAFQMLSDEPTPVRDLSPGVSSSEPRTPSGAGADPGDMRTAAGTVGAVARGAENGGVPSSGRNGGERNGGTGDRTTRAEDSRSSAERDVKRMTTAIERVNKALTAEVLEAFPRLPGKVRSRFLQAVSELSRKAAELM